MLIGRCMPYGQGVTLWPLAEMLKAEAVVLDTDPADDASAKIAQLVETTSTPSCRRAVADGGGARRRPWDWRRRATRSSRSTRARSTASCVAAWRALLASAGRRAPGRRRRRGSPLGRPDDARRPRRARRAARRADPLPLHRAPGPPSLAPRLGRRTQKLQLAPLDPLSSGGGREPRLAHLLDVDALPDGAASTHSRALRGQSVLPRGDRPPPDRRGIARPRGWSVASPRRTSTTLEIPDSVHAVILARLDLLSPEEKRVAQRAAVVGRMFWDGAVRHADAGSTIVDAALTTLRRREFVVEGLYVVDRRPARSSPSSTCSSGTWPTRACRGRSAGGRTRRRPPGSSGRAASGQASVAELLAHHYDAAFSYLREEELRRRGALASPRRRRERAPPFRDPSRASASPGGRSSSPRRAPSVSRRSRRSATSTTSPSSATRPGGRTCEALAELSDERPRLRAARREGHALLDSLPRDDAGAARGRGGRVASSSRAAAPHRAQGRERTLLLVNRGFLLSQRRAPSRRGGRAAASAKRPPPRRSSATPTCSRPRSISCQTYEESGGRYGDAYRTDAQAERAHRSHDAT